MSKVTFSVSARTAKLIGQENFATAEGAIVELVKNCYDADASNCILIFDNDSENAENHSLYIIDNGIGMSQTVIIEQWMKIGTDEKLQNHLSDGGRVKTGAKGIGRFALDRLGVEAEMMTVDKTTGKGLFWSVNWSDFDQLGVAINEVTADLDVLTNTNLKKVIVDEIKVPQKLNDYLEEIDFTSGTILKIQPLKDKWDEESIKSLFDNLEVLIPPQEQPEFSIFLCTKNNSDEFGEVGSAYYDDFDYKVSTKFLADEANTFKITVTRNELDVNALKNDFVEVFNNPLLKDFPFDLKTFEKPSFEFTRTVDEFSIGKSIDKELLKNVGEFSFTFYFFKNQIDPGDKDRYPYKDINQANRRSWLQKFGGVKVFRDDFRVRPYGESGQDWLGLGNRQARSPGGAGQKLGGYRIGPNQISGTVKISRVANASFQDKSGREGIQENDTFELFKNLLKEMISVFERDRNVIMFALSELAKKRRKDLEEKERARAEAERILREEAEAAKRNKQPTADDAPTDAGTEGEKSPANNSTGTTNTPTEVLLARTNVNLEQDIEDKNEEIRLLRGLASVGLIITSFAHELKGLRSRLVPRTEFLTKELKKHIPASALSNIQKEDNPFYMVDLIKEEDIKLKHWLDYSLSTLKRDKRKRTNINIGEYFTKFVANWKMALDQRKIAITLVGNNNATNVVRGFEIDFDAIFNNLLSNSLAAFKERKGAYSREVKIGWKIAGEFMEIKFSDNGAGLAKAYANEPDKIFEFNESSRTDRTGNQIGTGMGLYIVRLVVADYNGAQVQIVPVQEGFTMLFKFALRKDKQHGGD